MKKRIARLGILVLSTLSLSSCAYFRGPGPCYGVGCRAFAPVQTPQHAMARARTRQRRNPGSKNSAPSVSQGLQGN